MVMGVTANTTAKITSQHGLLYDYLLNTFGFKTAKGYLDSNEESIKTIKNKVKKEEKAPEKKAEGKKGDSKKSNKEDFKQ